MSEGKPHIAKHFDIERPIPCQSQLHRQLLKYPLELEERRTTFDRPTHPSFQSELCFFGRKCSIKQTRQHTTVRNSDLNI